MRQSRPILRVYTYDGLHCSTMQVPLQNLSRTASMYTVIVYCYYILNYSVSINRRRVRFLIRCFSTICSSSVQCDSMSPVPPYIPWIQHLSTKGEILTYLIFCHRIPRIYLVLSRTSSALQGKGYRALSIIDKYRSLP